MKVKIEVTEEDIRKGKANYLFCPIALAVKRVLKPKYRNDVAVYGKDMWCVSGRRDLPKKGQRFVSRFDDGKHVKPFSFRIDIDEDKLQG